MGTVPVSTRAVYLFSLLQKRATIDAMQMPADWQCTCVHVNALWHDLPAYRAAIEAARVVLDRLIECEAVRLGVTVARLWEAHMFAVKCGRGYLILDDNGGLW